MAVIKRRVKVLAKPTEEIDQIDTDTTTASNGNGIGNFIPPGSIVLVLYVRDGNWKESNEMECLIPFDEETTQTTFLLVCFSLCFMSLD
jgi:hypothetical protein